MIKTIFGFILVIVVSIYPQIVQPKVSIPEPQFDFGSINQSDIVEHKFVITNTGGDVLNISDFHASCGCTAAKPEKTELKPGESTQLKVTFNSKGRKGPQIKTVTFKTNDPDRSVATVTIKGNVVVKEESENKSGAKIFLPESNHDFGKVKEGSVVHYTFELKNTGTLPLVIKDIKTSCGCTAAVVNEKNIEPGKTGSIKVDLDTSKREGRMNRTVTIVSNDTNEPNKIISISADVVRN